ncbi:MAG: hypothetical protein QGH99_12175 [Pseudomonadales bacterium]|nr:hypothetical protein [Pseudomonadales bacterium]
MATYDAVSALPDGEPGPWGDPVAIRYDRRDVLLYAVGIGIRDLGFVFEGHANFSVFPTTMTMQKIAPTTKMAE